MPAPKILVVANDAQKIAPYVSVLNGHEYAVDQVNRAEAAHYLDSTFFDVVLTDCPATDKNGDADFFNLIHRQCPQTKCILLTGEKTAPPPRSRTMPPVYIDAFSRDRDPRELTGVIEKLTADQAAHQQVADSAKTGGIIGESSEIHDVFDIIAKVARTDSTILITGESGTGKELVARAIHDNSQRAENPMMIINCSAIPEELLESELFGHEKGAFTGAHRSRQGRFELAHQSTLFLDEIGDMSLNLQVKLLRVLQEQTFERVGGTQSISVDLRIIAATNKDLSAAIRDGSFREDLYYRLNVIPIKMAPLRHRKSDISLLVAYFQQKLAARTQAPPKRFSPEALSILENYDWPGNIRELENMTERLSVLVSGDTVNPSDLPDYFFESPAADPATEVSDTLPFAEAHGFNEAVEQYQKTLILRALENTHWVKSKAAERLQIKRTTLVEKIKKFKLEPDPPPEE